MLLPVLLVEEEEEGGVTDLELQHPPSHNRIVTCTPLGVLLSFAVGCCGSRPFL